MAKRILSTGGLILAVFLFFQPSFAQNCDTLELRLNTIDLDRNVKTFSCPIELWNSCPLGGLEFQILTEPAAIITPLSVNINGGVLSNWDYIGLNYRDGDSTRLFFVGIANMPGGNDVPSLSPGQWFLGEIAFRFECDFETNLEVIITADSAYATDSTGYEVYEMDLSNGAAIIGDDTAMRGDANCNGNLIGSDVTYLVGYFRGVNPCPCSMRAGDANSDNQIIGSDVTYLVRYFGGQGPPPGD